MEPEFLAIINSWRATLDDTEIALLRGMREESERLGGCAAPAPSASCSGAVNDFVHAIR
jgi:hypothetical protein